ncbi:hypothetical protein RFI_40398, partial [Reticulomyxa filosa]
CCFLYLDKKKVVIASASRRRERKFQERIDVILLLQAFGTYHAFRSYYQILQDNSQQQPNARATPSSSISSESSSSPSFHSSSSPKVFLWNLDTVIALVLLCYEVYQLAVFASHTISTSGDSIDDSTTTASSSSNSYQNLTGEHLKIGTIVLTELAYYIPFCIMVAPMFVEFPTPSTGSCKGCLSLTSKIEFIKPYLLVITLAKSFMLVLAQFLSQGKPMGTILSQLFTCLVLFISTVLCRGKI